MRLKWKNIVEPERPQMKMQWKPLIKIILGPALFDNIHRLITLSGVNI